VWLDHSSRSAGNVQDTSKKTQEQATRLEESTRRIDELTRERTSLEHANAELRGQLKEQRKAHQGMTNLTRELVSLAMIVYSETCSSP
jgi:predicted transcriptional regulator